MADMTYVELEALTYDELSAKTYALTSENASGDDNSGGSTSASCVWTAEKIASIESRLLSIESILGTLATQSALNSAQNAIISACKTATGFATPDDVAITTITETVDLSDLKAYGDSRWKTASGFATPDDVTVTTTTQEVQVVSQTVDVSGLATAVEVQNAQEQIEKVFSLIARWAVTGNTLAVYNKDGSVMETFTLVRDGDGNITGCS